ncbi:hypothetical protein BCR37DRAFT_343834 [Protomyces lactucae-debilis]|uniref:MYND-type domain-containing protein n=1 Tax=Protomyces lactucae-debilis TaxID=2754530 RepID=A0A1Y2FQB8_PROLT|nr:uncharacterized protein BCR37DRAFT_343834 [Protomyces lactucae-debilis]ORY86129.1 hypothetical protein BCR37DRAFT_343834 [Protomyces lactucae-debilis]
MRDPDQCQPHHNRAVLAITPAFYDRRALDTRADYALFTSLTHLGTLVQSSPKVRDALVSDGGIERLVRILQEGKLKRRLEPWQSRKWQQALLDLVYLAARGSEHVRRRLVEAGIIPVLVTVLCHALEDLASHADAYRSAMKKLQQRQALPARDTVPQRAPASYDMDVVWCLRILTYLTKYPNLRSQFSGAHDDLSDSLRLPYNLFSIVEKFTMPINTQDATYWAAVVMRNTCRKDLERGGIRQCAHLECGKWETKDKQFAKCRRCRRAKYCSKQCQSKAWTGHKWWCEISSKDQEQEIETATTESERLAREQQLINAQA